MDNIVYILTIFTVIFIWLNISKKETKNYYIKMFDTFKIYIVLGLIIMFLLFCNNKHCNDTLTIIRNPLDI
jgi:general stress protein CsbA